MSKTLRVTESTANQNLRDVLLLLQTAVCDMIFNTAGLVIGSGSKKKVKVANTIYGIVNGVLFSKTTAEVTLAGTVTNAKFNVFVITAKSDGTLTATMGTEGAALINVVLPAIPANEAVVGFVIVNPTGTGNFVGATTDLDDATVVPNAVYVNTPYPFNPNALTL
jgi:hypothetical protein